jgi:hypothetical protein
MDSTESRSTDIAYSIRPISRSETLPSIEYAKVMWSTLEIYVVQAGIPYT